MGRGGNVEIRPNSIRLRFTWNGEVCNETLRTDGKPMPPTPANVKYAKRIAAEIRDRIRYGTFVYAEYFPDSPKATTGKGMTLGEHLDTWYDLQTGLAHSTLKGYRMGVNFWKGAIGEIQLRQLKHSDILRAIATRPDWTGKTRNNKVSILRLALDLAKHDKILQSDPLDGLKPAEHQRPEPDPFSLEEAEAIIGYMREKFDPQVANYFEFKFFTGLRTSESLLVKWDQIDSRRSQLVVSGALVLGMEKDSTKTNSTRAVQLNSRALAALASQKAHTKLAGNLVFLDPKTRKRWVDDWTPREMYWRPALTRLGMRYRSPYHTRHTYATLMLMSGVTPAYAAKQMGHSIEEFLRTYSKWIDGGQNAVEMGKVETILGQKPGQMAGNQG